MVEHLPKRTRKERYILLRAYEMARDTGENQGLYLGGIKHHFHFAVTPAAQVELREFTGRRPSARVRQIQKNLTDALEAGETAAMHRTETPHG